MATVFVLRVWLDLHPVPGGGCREQLDQAFDRALASFQEYHNATEGWSREYDGIDPGYLSATVSFLGKVYQRSGDERLLAILKDCAFHKPPPARGDVL